MVKNPKMLKKSRNMMKNNEKKGKYVEKVENPA